MAMRTLKDLNVEGLRVLLRGDLNVHIKDGQITDGTRITETLVTLDYLLKQGASVVLCSHLGRPSGIGFEAKYSLVTVEKFLETLGYDIRLASGVVGEAVEAEAQALRPGQILLLENLRFEKGETENHPEFAEGLARLANAFVCDAFGCAHRPHASVSGVVSHFPKERTAAGLLLEKEEKALSRVLHADEPPLVAVMGGSKVSDKIDLIRHFLGEAEAILIGGAMSYTFLKAQGHPIGKSRCEEDKLDLALELLAEAQAKGTRLLLPQDHVVAREFHVDSPASVTPDVAIPEDAMGLDIGPETVALFVEAIRRARTLVWNGPMGVFEWDSFASGTLSIAEEMADAADRGAFVLVGGGDSVSAANRAGVVDRISHVSTGGGASLEFLSGIELPGIAALQA